MVLPTGSKVPFAFGSASLTLVVGVAVSQNWDG
jgi:hypothetical protein